MYNNCNHGAILKLISVAEMRNLEDLANSAGYSYAEMMKAAGEGIADYVDKCHQGQAANTAIGLVGGGNNGGDTLVALSELQRRGWSTFAILVQERNIQDQLLAKYLRSGGKVADNTGLHGLHENSGIVLDGIYGTGFRPPLPESISSLLSGIEIMLPQFTWIAVDCPSGVNCQTGEVSEGTIKCDVTVCLEAVKNGMLAYKAFPYLGKLVVVDLGLEKFRRSDSRQADTIVNQDLVRTLLPKRDAFSHKGSFGKCLIIGGCVNYPGAPVLVGRGAYAVGTGLVQVAVPASIYQSMLASCPELTWLTLEDAGGMISEIAAETILPYQLESQSAVIGPGLGRAETTKRFLHDLLLQGSNHGKTEEESTRAQTALAENNEHDKAPPLVIDADGLYLLSEEEDWPRKLTFSAVLTPHPGEMGRLTGLSVEEVQKDRMEIARSFALKWQQIVVLKGPLSVIADTEGQVWIIPVASSSLAKAGTGDVLAGMIGGLLAQGLKTRDAAIAGAWLHAHAGLLARATVGCEESVLAGDIIRAIPEVYRKL